MRCLKCNYENQNGSRFCENCGSPIDINQQPMQENNMQQPVQQPMQQPIQENNMQQPVQNNYSVLNQPNNIQNSNKKPNDLVEKIKKIPMQVKIIIILIIAIAGGLIYYLNYLKPENTALRCLNYTDVEDADKLIACFSGGEYIENPYTTKEEFDALYEAEKEDIMYMFDYSSYGVATSYSVLDAEVNDDIATLTVKMTYTYDDETETETETITMIKSKEFLIFETWIFEESILDLYETDIEVTVPSGTELYINDVLVSDSLKTEEESYDLYTIESLLDTEHNFKVKSNGTTLIDEDKDYFYYLDFTSISTSDFEDLDLMEENILDIVNDLYSGILDEKAFSDLKDNFSDIEIDSLEDNYDELYEDISTYYYGTLTYFNATDVIVSSIEFKNSYYLVTFKLEHDYTVEYKEEVYEKTDEIDYYQSLYIVKEGNSYVLVDIDDIPSYFTRY
ncbi:MAG: zinc ribbon domain-containing protein [Mycoplasmatota bacterium]